MSAEPARLVLDEPMYGQTQQVTVHSQVTGSLDYYEKATHDFGYSC